MSKHAMIGAVAVWDMSFSHSLCFVSICVPLGLVRGCLVALGRCVRMA